MLFAEKLIHNKGEAEDIATETFLKLLKKKFDFDNIKDIRSFLFTAARNACFNFLRSPRHSRHANGDPEYYSLPDETFGEAEMITAKVLQTIYTEMEALPGHFRVTLFMRVRFPA